MTKEGAKKLLEFIETLDEFKDMLPTLLHNYDPNPQSSDYECVFCFQRSDTNQGTIDHKANCLGIRLSKVLEA